MWPARHYSQWRLLRSTEEGEDRREEGREERMRGCDEGCGSMGILLYTSRDPRVTARVPENSLVSIGGRRT